MLPKTGTLKIPTPIFLGNSALSLTIPGKQHWRLDSPINMVRVMAFLPLNELPALFPHVVDWISYLEKQTQESGRALTPIEFNLAQNVGVAHPEEVRILSVRRIPLPSHPRVKQLARRVGLLNADTGGLTAVYGVIVRVNCEDNLRLLTHEFVHVAQYERLGKVGFLEEYFQQIAAHGYPNALLSVICKIVGR